MCVCVCVCVCVRVWEERNSNRFLCVDVGGLVSRVMCKKCKHVCFE